MDQKWESGWHMSSEAEYLSEYLRPLRDATNLPEEVKAYRVKTLRKLYIEATSKCNFSCAMCPRRGWDDKNYRHMDWEVFTKAVDDARELGTVETVFIGGFGEPLCYPRIADMVKYIRRSGYRAEMITNGMLLDEKMITALLDAGINALWVSFDGDEADNSGHSAFGAGTVYENLKLLQSLRVSRRPEELCELNLTSVIMKSNLGQLERIMETAHVLNAQNVMFTNLMPYYKETLDEICYEGVIQRLAGTKQETPSLTRVSLPFTDLDEPGMGEFVARRIMENDPLELGKCNVGRDQNRCPFIHDGDTFVGVDGGVYPCMALLHSAPVYLFEEERHISAHSFGNVAEKPLAEIWNSPEYVDFRRRVMDFRFSPCVHCGGCDLRKENLRDCYGNEKPTCGACLWATGIVQCP